VETIAEVVLCMGRFHLRVAGFYLAMEGDLCRDGNIPEGVLPPIPEEELATATIGGQPTDVVRFFRGDRWNEAMLQHVADEINKRVSET
jgi:hypothetical protein